MAAKLQAETNVHVLKPRKAKGSKSTGGRKPAKVAKPRPGAKPIPDQPSDADIRRDRQDRALALHSQIKVTENKISIASEALSDLRTTKKQQRAAMGNIYPLELYDDARKDADRKTEKVDLALREKTRAEIREAFGLPAGPQAELDLKKTPDAARPALHWYDVGFHDCMDGKFSDPQGAGVPPENTTDYTRGFSEATARIGAGMQGLAADEKAAKAEPPLMTGEDPAKAAAKAAAKAEPDLPPGAPNWRGWPDNPGQWMEEQKTAFGAWFETLGPEDEVDIIHVGAAAYFDYLIDGETPTPEAADAEEVAEALVEEDEGEPVEEEQQVHAGPAPAGVIYMLSSEEPFASGRQATYKDGGALDAEIPSSGIPVYDEHPFEAGEAELAGQAPRRAIQERRTAETGGEPAFSDE